MTTVVEKQVRDFIIENFLFGDVSRQIDATTSLIENDLVDSTGILELVAFVEERFGISVADQEIVPDNFDSLARITAYVSAKTAQPETAQAEKAA